MATTFIHRAKYLGVYTCIYTCIEANYHFLEHPEAKESEQYLACTIATTTTLLLLVVVVVVVVAAVAAVAVVEGGEGV